MGPSRGVRAGGSAGAASQRHRAISHEVSRRSGDTSSDGPGRLLVTAQPARRFDALRVVVLRTVHLAEARRRPPMRFRASSETCPCSPAPQRRTTGRSRGRPVPRCCLSWAFMPHDTVPDRQTRLKGGGTNRHRVPRARFGYPLRDVHHRSSRRAKRRSVPGLCPTRRSPRARVVPFSGSLPS
jgi:hypothetical protein